MPGLPRGGSTAPTGVTSSGGAATQRRPVHGLAIDLGAGSGRAMLARYDGDRLALEEIHRFGGYAAERLDGPHWDWRLLLSHVEESLRRAKAAIGRVDSIGVDSWGCDYALFDETGALLTEPYHYRHPRSQRGRDAIPLPGPAFFAATGAQDFAPDTIFQLYDEVRHHPGRIARAAFLLMIADAVTYHLTGVPRSDVTLARTSGLLDGDAAAWSADLCERFGLPGRLLQPLTEPGTIIGPLRPALADHLGWGPVPVVAVAAHDTASAVVALAPGRDVGFLICGTWFLVGVETEAPVLSPAALAARFGNEGGAGGRTFLVKSLAGLYLIQKLRDSWSRRTGQAIEFAAIATAAETAMAVDAVPSIDVADPVFFDPPDMIEAIIASVAEVGASAVTAGIGWLAAVIYKGLAEQARRAAADAEIVLGRALRGFVLAGGGAQDRLLCRLIADALGRPVMIGPVEATAWGNAVVQLVGIGQLDGIDEARQLVRRSAPFVELARSSGAADGGRGRADHGR